MFFNFVHLPFQLCFLISFVQRFVCATLFGVCSAASAKKKKDCFQPFNFTWTHLFEQQWNLQRPTVLFPRLPTLSFPSAKSFPHRRKQNKKKLVSFALYSLEQHVDRCFTLSSSHVRCNCRIDTRVLEKKKGNLTYICVLGAKNTRG